MYKSLVISDIIALFLGNNIVGDGLINIAISYAELSDSYEGEEIAKEFVIPIEGMILTNYFSCCVFPL